MCQSKLVKPVFLSLILHQVMRSNLEPLIDTLFEEDELFAQDFEADGLNRVLFIRRMGIYVEVSKDHSSN